ncbi:DUF1826 domain-containing protein [Alkalimonas amylolytica]|uniref:DUF1826 domain-containing protein n=1 Tax=Alkalimonas amylolytica TaxID=152573 RepID=A0A1H4E954_ALKAM|nr:DUF1826 domain-containing protein [Alkalimonas amylolytica]SEA81604.1 Protein of unknown function [Alkalimonas amylolytica]
MSTIAQIRPEPTSEPNPANSFARQQLGAERDSLLAIFEPDVNLAVWQRALAPAIDSYCKRLLDQLSLPLQRMLPIQDIADALTEALPAGDGKTDFIGDIQLLADIFACLMDCPQLGLRLRVLDKPMCPKFHTDHLLCRLVCTYSGPATEWHGGLIARPETTMQLQTADVALLKGSGWDGSQCHAISHRSPASSGKRLLLTLDPVW